MYKRVIILFVSILIFVLALILYVMKHQTKEHFLLKISTYDIECNTKKTKINEIDTEVNKYVEDRINEYFHSIEITPNKEASLNITDDIIDNGDTMIIILNSTIKHSGYIKYNRSTIHYNKKIKQILKLQNYLANDENLQIISNLSFHYVQAYLVNNDMIIDEAIVREATNNLQNYSFTSAGLEIVFILKGIVDNEVKITIPYAEINYLLKEQYKKPQEEKYQRDLNQFKNKKLIAFTFDDGPNEQTTHVLLNGLAKYNAKVTFFVVGNMVNGNSKALKRAYEEGNQIGSHTYNHKNLIKLSGNQVRMEVINTATVVKNIIGEEPTVIRPPYGNINKLVKSYMNVPIIMWNLDTLDWKYRDKEIVKNNIIVTAKDGDIVLLHDLYLSSVEGALLAMDELYKQGFAFVTVEEMAKLKGIEWEQGKYYYNL